MKQLVQDQKENIATYFIFPRKVALIYASVVFALLLALWWYAGAFLENRFAEDERKNVGAQVDTLGTSLTLALNQRLILITSVHSYMEAKITQYTESSSNELDEFNDLDAFISSLYSSTAGIRNIAIAPGGVMQYVYPYEENKNVLGYQPVQDERPNVRAEVQRAIDTGDIVLSLPYELIQGGQGLIARQAIFVNDIYWGLANLVIDVPPLLEESGVSFPDSGLKLALKDQAGQVFFGSENIYMMEPLTFNITLPEGNWELAGIPDEGWHVRYRSTLLFYRVMGLIGAFTISLVIYMFINRRERLAQLVEWRTNELAQANQTLINVLEGIDADVYVADIETYEILFANRHLRESFNTELLGKQCYQVFRHEKSVCEHCMNNRLFDANGEPKKSFVWDDRNPITERWYHNADRAIRWHDGRYVHLQIATDITEYKEATKAIHESEERYRNLFDSVPVGIYRSTPDGFFLDGNPALIEMLGFPDQETLLAADIKDLYIDTDDRSKELNLIEQKELVKNYRLQLRRYDGSVIWVQDSSNAVRDSLGNTIYYYGRLEDITERVQAEKTLQEVENNLKALLQEKEILLAEVHHRVKNNMQVITSLLSLQAEEFTDTRLQEIYEESRSRINSMALVHEQLYHSKEYARIAFDDYVDQLTTSLLNSYSIQYEKVKLHIDTNNLYLDLERAIPCGLLLNELLTNSLKYAFPNGRDGQVWIKMRTREDKVTLDFSDDGIGLAENLDLENVQSLGLQLVHLLVKHDLRGSLKFGNREGQGAYFHIEFLQKDRKR